jgi:autotransporter translocation and assembly factor TamB
VRKRRFWFVAGGLVALAVLLGAVFIGPLAHLAIVAGARSAGYDVAYDGLTNHGGRLVVTGLDVRSTADDAEPLAHVDRIAVSYDLAHVFGGPYLYGITGIAVDRPHITIVHHKDGSYNFTLPPASGKPSAAPPPIPKIRLAVTGGSIAIADATRIFAHSRKLAISDVALDADVDPKKVSHVALGLTIHEADGTFPVSGRGTLDETRGYELSRITAKTVGLAPLIDYALNSTSLHVANGVLNDVDARIYGLPDRHGAMQRHVSITANLDHFQPYLNGIAKPLRDGRGSLRVYDDGLAIPKVDGSIAGVPVRIAGAIYDLAKPSLRLGIVGHGDLRALLTLSDAAKNLPVTGPVAFTLFVEGDATQPTTLATFRSPRFTYANIPIDDTHGLVALHGQDTSILQTALGYNGATLATRGNLHVETKHTGVDILASIDAPLQRFPYASTLLGGMVLHADTILAGVDASAVATGVLDGTGAGADAPSVSGTFSIGENGVGTIGPIAIDGPGSRGVYARIAFDRPRFAGGAAFLSARDVAFSTAGPQPALPGISLARVPNVSGTVDADVAGAFAAKRFTLGGSAHGRGLRAFGYPIDDLSARASVVDGARVAIDARYRGALAPLARAAGGSVTATGSADIPMSILTSGPSDVLAQIHDARFTGASIAGIALDGIEGTARVRGSAIDVYAARATLDGHDVVAQGSFGNGGTLEVSASGIDLAKLRAAGLPVSGGDVSAVATIGGSAASPHVEGGVAASDVRLTAPQAANLPLSADTGLTYDDGRLDVHDALALAGPAVGELDGRIAGLRGSPSDATYTFRAGVRHADIATLARIAHANAQHPEGTLEANVAVSGRGSAPHVTGDLSVPNGSINGLRFHDASVNLAGGRTAIAARNGRITIGSSVLGFDADVSARAQRASLRAPKIDLSDFNDYFDAGDTLGGTGSLAVGVQHAPDRIATTGRVHLVHTRFHRFEVGDTNATWSTSGHTVETNVAVTATSGEVRAGGNIVLPATQPLRDTLHRTTLALDTRASNVDLNVWLPALGFQAPVTGFVNANATISGTYPRVTAVAHADLQRGMAGRVAIRTGTLDLRAANGRATITSALLAIDDLSVTAQGSAGLTPGAPFDVTVTARTPDVGALGKVVTGTTYDAAGTLATTLRLSGTLAQPSIADSIDGESLRYGTYTVPRAHAEIAVTRSRASLDSAEVDLQKGRILASGYAPLESSPPGVGPANAPIALDLTAERVDFAQFAALLPKGTVLAGLLDGKVGLVGSLAHPGLAGTLAVTNGSFVGPQETSKITDFASQVTFAGRTLTLHDTSAKVGGGTIAASGTISVPDLRDPVDSASANLAFTSTDAVFDLPSLFKGRVNGSVTIARQPRANALVAGSLDVTSARIPTTALLPKTTGSPAPNATPLPVSLALAVNVGNDVRVQGGPVDIGAKGKLTVGGTVGSPTVKGELESTGGTLSFYRTFVIQYPTTVAFDGTGVIPYVDALATTTVDNPQTDVSLHVTGPATQLNIAFSSDPSYSREQIVGILVGAQALGAVSGIPNTPGSQSAQQNPFQAVAEGQLGSLLTQNILEPFSSQLGGAVGLSNLAINYAPGSGASIGAQKKILKNVSLVFADSFNYPQRQSIGVLASPNKSTAAQFTFFSQPASNRFDTFEGVQSLNSTNESVTAAEPASGSSGFSFSLQRKF